MENSVITVFERILAEQSARPRADVTLIPADIQHLRWTISRNGGKIA
jgi:hypothetical protein